MSHPKGLSKHICKIIENTKCCCRGRDRMVAGFTDVVSSNLDQGEVYNITVSSTNKTDRHDITEILLKMVLKTIKQTKCCIFF
jgi:hypothetical protein